MFNLPKLSLLPTFEAYSLAWLNDTFLPVNLPFLDIVFISACIFTKISANIKSLSPKYKSLCPLKYSLTLPLKNKFVCIFLCKIKQNE